MAPKDFRKDQRSKGSKGGRPPFGGKPKTGGGNRPPFAGKPKPGGDSRPFYGDKPKSKPASSSRAPYSDKPKSKPAGGGHASYSDKPRSKSPGGSRPPYSDKPKSKSPGGGHTSYSDKPRSKSPGGGRPHHAGKPKPGGSSRPPYADKFRPDTAGSAPRPARVEKPARSDNWLYGLHAVQAALANPRRKLGRVLLTSRMQEIIGDDLLSRVRVETMEMDAIGKFLPPGAVHQGAALETGPLPVMDLDALLSRPKEGRRRIVLVLDQLSDPHNVGAILRSAAAFGVIAVVVQDRNAPPQTGVLAKAASGALDLIPYVEVVNIARALDQLAEHGFWRIALAGDGGQPLAEAIPDGDVALVLGSEGDGIRRLVRERCEAAAFIPMAGVMESLNVSNAAAIALYELSRV